MRTSMIVFFFIDIRHQLAVKVTSFKITRVETLSIISTLILTLQDFARSLGIGFGYFNLQPKFRFIPVSDDH